MLIGIAGDLGSGKTLTLTLLALKSYLDGETIYSNYKLYGIPYVPITDIEQIEEMQSGFFAADELWLWCDSRVSTSNKNKMISRILIQSRKKGLTIGYTAQGLHQIDKRVRLITDINLFPQILDSNLLKVRLFKGIAPIGVPFYFNPILCYPFFNTTEIVEDVESGIRRLDFVFHSIEENTAWRAFLELNNFDEKSIKTINEQLKKEIQSFQKSAVRHGDRRD